MFDSALYFLILLGTIANRGPGQAVALIIMIDHLRAFQHRINHLMHLRES